MKKKILLFFTILILMLGTQVLAKSMTTADFEALVKKCGYEDFGSLDEYKSSNSGVTLDNIKTYLNNNYPKFITRYFNDDGTLNSNKFYVGLYSQNISLKFDYSNPKNIYTYTTYNATGSSTIRKLACFNITSKTFTYRDEGVLTNYFMSYNNFSNMNLDTFKSEEFQRLMMKTLVAYADGDVFSSAKNVLNLRTSYAIGTTTYNDTEYKGAISYNSYFNKFKFTFTSGWDLNQDYNFYLERFEIQEDDTLEAKGIHRLTSHNAHAAADKGLYGFSGQHGNDVFPLEEIFELDLNGVDTSQKYVYRVCIGSITDNADNTVSTTPFISSDLLVFNENTLYTYPYFKFDYSYTEITKVAYDPNYTDPTEPDNPDIDKDYTNSIKDVGDRITNKLEETKTGILNGIWDLFKKALEYLFQPNEEQIKSLVNDVTSNDVVSDSILGVPLTLMSRFLNLFINREYTDFKVEWGNWNLKLIGSEEPTTIIKSGSYNISKMVRDDETQTKIYNLYMIFVNVGASLGFIWWAVGFFKDMLSLSEAMPGANNETDDALDGSSPTDDEAVESARRFYYENYGRKRESAAKDFYRSRIRKMERGKYYGNKK